MLALTRTRMHTKERERKRELTGLISTQRIVIDVTIYVYTVTVMAVQIKRPLPTGTQLFPRMVSWAYGREGKEPACPSRLDAESRTAFL